MDAESSTSQNNETVTLRLPSGEDVDAIVPSGYSDDQVRDLMKMKHPELVGPPGATSKNAQQVLPGAQSDVDMQEQPMTTAERQNFSSRSAAGKLVGLPGVNPHTPTAKEAIGDVALAGLGPYAAVGAGSAIPTVAKTAGGVLAKHPLLSYAAIEAAKHISGIGPYLSKIPGIEWLPLLAGGEFPGKIGRLGKIGEAAAEGKAIPTAVAEGESAEAASPTSSVEIPAAPSAGSAPSTLLPSVLHQKLRSLCPQPPFHCRTSFTARAPLRTT